MKRTFGYVMIVGLLLAALAPMAGAVGEQADHLPQVVNLREVQQGTAPDVPTTPTVVSYQGQVIVNTTPFTGTGFFKFAIVNIAGTTSFWSNDGTSVNGGEPTANVALSVSGGLFNVLLGDQSLPGMTEALDASVFSDSGRYLRVWFATSSGGPYTQLSPDQRISSVPFALNADTLDGQDASAFALANHNHFGQTWSGNSTNGLTLNNSGATGLSASGNSYGLYGSVGDTTGTNYGVFGIANGTGALNYGVHGTSDDTGVWGNTTGAFGYGVFGSSSYIGVFGSANGSAGSRGVSGNASGAGTDYGVYGSSDDTGVWGGSTGPSGTGVYAQGYYGVYGSGDFIGMYAQASGTTNITHRGVYATASGPGTDYGVWGESDETGVYGSATNPLSPATYGIYGTSSATGVYGSGNSVGLYGTIGDTVGTNYAVYGAADNAGATDYGIYGQSDDTGVYGSASSTIFGTHYGLYGTASGSGTNYGVYGTSADTGVYGSGSVAGVRGESNATGVFGYSTSGAGVYGNSISSYGVWGDSSTTGVYGTGNATGVYGTSSATGVRGTSSTSAVNYGVYGNAGGAGTDAGVYGTSDDTGVYGQGYYGVYGFGSGVGSYGVYGLGYDVGVYGEALDPDSGFGFFTNDVIYTSGHLYALGGCTGCGGLNLPARNGSGETLGAGDLVAVMGIEAPLVPGGQPVMVVRKAVQGEAVIGVVQSAGRLQTLTRPNREGDGEVSDTTFRAADGPAAPGDLLIVVTHGPTYVKVTGAVAVNDLLIAGAEAGKAQVAPRIQVEGITMRPDGVLGRVLGPADPATGLVPVFVTLQ